MHYTATQQWDELLEIAQQWAKMDRRRADETSEEEDEEEFIDDNTRYIAHSTKLQEYRLNECIITSSALSDAPYSSRGSTAESDLVVNRVATPPLQGASQSHIHATRGYIDSPPAAKRKRMEELAKQRKKKKYL